MPNSFKGKNAVVTGAAAGIGKGCLKALRNAGANVVGVDLQGSDRQCDLTDEPATTALFQSLQEELGHIDILINAAAFAIFDWIEELTYDDWKKTLSCELDIVFLPTRAAWPLLKKSSGASIVNFASANARHALEGSAALAHCAGKGGVLAMTRQLAMEGAPHNIRANTISPGFILTEATGRHMQAEPALKKKVLAKNMIKRLGQPEDIAACVLWLASGDAGYVTGADIPVDGGATAW